MNLFLIQVRNKNTIKKWKKILKIMAMQARKNAYSNVEDNDNY